MYVFAHNNLKVRSNNNQTFFKNAKSKTKRYDLKHPVTRYLLLLELASVFVFVSKILCALWWEIPIIVQKFETFISFKKVKYDSRCQLKSLVKNGKK